MDSNYGSYMDRKQQPEYVLDILQEVANVLGYSLRLLELPISENDGRPWEEHLEILNNYISDQGYELIPLYDQWTGFHLFPRSTRRVQISCTGLDAKSTLISPTPSGAEEILWIPHSQ